MAKTKKNQDIGYYNICYENIVFQMQQLCSNFNSFKITCSTSMPEIMLVMLAQNITDVWAYIVVLYYLQYISSYIAANLQQICYSMIFFGKWRSPAVPELFLLPF